MGSKKLPFFDLFGSKNNLYKPKRFECIMGIIKDEKSRAKVSHLANWYYGNFCAMKYGHGKECYDKLHELAGKLETKGIREMTHKEFCIIIRENLNCKPTKRKIDNCPICRAIWISNHKV